MSLFLRSMLFISSLIIFLLIFLISYKVGKKRGIKKALYRITYRCICVILSFLIAPYLTDYILNFDLYPHGLAIHYQGLNFYRIIDFIEEVIVHSEILNDIYFLLPNLKSLLIDFPHVVFIPFAYLLAFALFSLLLLPLYFYLAYRRKKRTLYDVSYKNGGKIAAGILTGINVIVLISILLTPVNGLVRIYSDAKVGQINYDENICEQSEYLEKYEFTCLLLEGYDSTVFSFIGKNPVNKYIYDSLTRVEYGGNNTNFSNEIVSIAQAGIILNKTGLLNAINSGVEDFGDIDMLDFNGLTSNDVDTIISAFENSLYTREVLLDVYDWSGTYLNFLLKEELDVDVGLNLTYDELINELRIILSAINLILNNDAYIENFNTIYKMIDDFSKLHEDIRDDDDYRIVLFLNAVYHLDLEALRTIYNYLSQSKVYRLVVPNLLDTLLSTLDTHVNMSANPDEMDRVIRLCFDLFQVIKNHEYTYNILTLISELSDEEVSVIASVATYISQTETMNTFFYDIVSYAIGTLHLKFDIPTELLLKIRDWYTELKLARLVVGIVDKAVSYEIVDYAAIWEGLTTYQNTVIFNYAWKWATGMLPEAARAWISGKGFDYLVGDYVLED